MDFHADKGSSLDERRMCLESLFMECNFPIIARIYSLTDSLVGLETSAPQGLIFIHHEIEFFSDAHLNHSRYSIV